MREAERVLQLDPAPPEMGNINDYITAAVQERDLKHFSFFLRPFYAVMQDEDGEETGEDVTCDDRWIIRTFSGTTSGPRLYRRCLIS